MDGFPLFITKNRDSQYNCIFLSVLNITFTEYTIFDGSFFIKSWLVSHLNLIEYFWVILDNMYSIMYNWKSIFDYFLTVYFVLLIYVKWSQIFYICKQLLWRFRIDFEVTECRQYRVLLTLFMNYNIWITLIK